MQKRNAFTHAVVVGAIVAVSLGIFQAVGAASDPTIASSSKFGGPTEPPSTWFDRSKIMDPGNAVLATPASGTALVVQSVTYGYIFGSSAAGQVGLYPDTQGDNCAHTLAPPDGYLDYTALAANATLMKNFQPGLVIPAGVDLCSHVVSNEAVISLAGYNIPAKAVPSPIASARALPKMP
jgi:hypothetical protein